ncbi:MAG: hypothetical protein AAF328_03585 [Planctomycetota bacterium]
MTTLHRSIPIAAARTPRKFRTVYVDPRDLLDLGQADPPTHASNNPAASPFRLTADTRAALLQAIRADVRDAADAVLTWLDYALQNFRDDARGQDPHALLDAILRPGPDPAAIQRPALCAAVAEHTGVELSPKRLATALRHLQCTDAFNAKAGPRRGPDRTSPTPGRTQTSEPTSDLSDPRPLALGLLAALRQAVGRRTDRDYADALPDEPIAAETLEADTLNYLRGALPGAPKVHPARTSLHDLLLTLAPLTAPDAPSPTADSDLQLVLHAAPALAALLGPDSLPATLAHLNTLVMLRDHVAPPVYLAEMLRLTHHPASLKTDADTAALHRFAKRHALPNLPGATRVASYAAVNACTRLLQQLFDGHLDPDTPIDVPPSWKHPDRTELQAFPLATALLKHLETTDAGFTLTPTTRLLFHTVQAHRIGDPEPALAHVRKLGPTKTTQRLAALADHDNHDEMIAATAALAQRALPQLNFATLATD